MTEPAPLDRSRILNIAKQPCFKEATLSASVMGVLAGAVAYRRRRNLMRSMDFVVGGWVAGLLGSWFLCRRSLRSQRERIRDAMQRQAATINTLPGDEE